MARAVVLLGGVLVAVVSAGACGGGTFKSNAAAGHAGVSSAGGSASGSGAGGSADAGGGASGEAGQAPTSVCTEDQECGKDSSDCAHHACTDGVCGVQTLAEGAPCAGGSCNAEHACIPSTCDNGKQDGAETAVDCGGGCPLCAEGQGCAAATDCLSGVCTSNRCAASSCTDKIKNGSETGIDCGGTCPLRCSLGQGCAVVADCAVAAGDLAESVRCLANVCTSTKPPTEGGQPRLWQDFAPARLVSTADSCGATDKVCLIGNGAAYGMYGVGTDGAHKALTKTLLFTTTGAVGGGGKFDGSYCLTRDLTDLSFLSQGAITGMAWVKSSRTAAPWESAIIGGFNHYFLALDANPASQRFLAALATTQSASFAYRSAPGLGTIAANEWHHVAAIYSTTTSKLSQYVDGKLVLASDIAGTTAATPVSVFVGCRKDSTVASQFFIGTIDEIVMYQRALSEAELTDYVRRTKP